MNVRLEKIEQKLEKVSKQMENLCSNNTLNTTNFISNFGEEIEAGEHHVQELFWTKNEKKSILLDSGAPKSVAGREWFNEYIRENDIKESEVKQQNVRESFKFGAGGLFESKTQVEIPFNVKDKKGNKSVVKMKLCLVDHDIPFLCGRDNIENLGVVIDFSQKTVMFKNINGKVYRVRNSQAGHYVIDFEKVERKQNVTHITEEREDEEDKTEKEDNLFKKVRKLHRLTNHKQEESMKHIYKDAGNETPEIYKTIKEVIKRCEVCQKKRKSQSAPRVSFMKASSFNDILTLDLKEKKVGGQKRYILWIICAFSRFAKGMALKSKEMSEVTKALYHGWFCNYGCPSMGRQRHRIPKHYVGNILQKLEYINQIWSSILSILQRLERKEPLLLRYSSEQIDGRRQENVLAGSMRHGYVDPQHQQIKKRLLTSSDCYRKSSDISRNRKEGDR